MTNMIRRLGKPVALLLCLLVAVFVAPAFAQSPAPKIGIVIMHGKGGSPSKHVADLASALEGKGYLVANIEMPWSGRRDYDTDVAGAEAEVAAALDGLRARGAGPLFVAGHSQGGLFALHFGARHPFDGVIAIAPGGSVGSPLFREKLGESLAQARKLVADGKGDQKASLIDFEGAKGSYPITVTPAHYLDWFSPDGAMDQSLAVRNISPRLPVLLIVPKNDYPGLLKAKQPSFDALPRHPLTRLYEPDSNHLGAPSAALDEIVRWTKEVVDAGHAPRP